MKNGNTGVSGFGLYIIIWYLYIMQVDFILLKKSQELVIQDNQLARSAIV